MSPFPTLEHEPATDAEWRAMARLAAGLLLIDNARVYGLISGGPGVDRDTCLAFLDRAAEHGIERNGQAEHDAGLVLLAAYHASEVSDD